VPKIPHSQNSPDCKSDVAATRVDILLDLFDQTAFARHGLDRSTFRVRHEHCRAVIDECEDGGFIRRENHTYFISLLGIAAVGDSPEAQQFFIDTELIYGHLQAAYRTAPNEMVTAHEIATRGNIDYETVVSCLRVMIDCNVWYCGYSSLEDPTSASVAPSEGILDSPSFAACVARMREVRGELAINSAAYGQFQILNFDDKRTAPVDAAENIQQKWISKLPGKLAQLLYEVHVAIDHRLYTLTSMGLRALIDTVILDKVGDAGTFKDKLKALQSAGFIAAHQLETLGAAIDAGNASAHRGFTPEEQDITTVQEIVEHLLQSVYVHPEKARELAQRTPKRNAALLST
jgi:hypothetical protein